jgi:hypothetical protein
MIYKFYNYKIPPGVYKKINDCDFALYNDDQLHLSINKYGKLYVHHNYTESASLLIQYIDYNAINNNFFLKKGYTEISYYNDKYYFKCEPHGKGKFKQIKIYNELKSEFDRLLNLREFW